MRYSKNKAQKQEATGARRMGFLDTYDYRAYVWPSPSTCTTSRLAGDTVLSRPVSSWQVHCAPLSDFEHLLAYTMLLGITKLPPSSLNSCNGGELNGTDLAIG